MVAAPPPDLILTATPTPSIVAVNDAPATVLEADRTLLVGLRRDLFELWARRATNGAVSVTQRLGAKHHTLDVPGTSFQRGLPGLVRSSSDVRTARSPAAASPTPARTIATRARCPGTTLNASSATRTTAATPTPVRWSRASMRVGQCRLRSTSAACPRGSCSKRRWSQNALSKLAAATACASRFTCVSAPTAHGRHDRRPGGRRSPRRRAARPRPAAS
jgi:hypothetical protein